MGELYIVATPIGNLDDITLRALSILQEADVIYAEDTRVTAKLLAKYDIQKSVQRLDEAKEHLKAQEVIARLESGQKVAYVSDAGTPGISDPGARLVAAARDAGFQAITIPGPSALTAALSIAGMPEGEFTFLGFLPHKKGRHTALKGIAESTLPVVLFESPHRIGKLLGEIDEVASQHEVTLLRELTKMHEDVLKGTAHEVRARLETSGTARGEMVVIVRPG